MALKVAINGFGRIGRNFVRARVERGGGFDVVAVNDVAPPDILAHLLRFDSSHGRLEGVDVDGDTISVDGTSFRVLGERDGAPLVPARRGRRRRVDGPLHRP
jgi:glyceraldehyde 3-phosphate dehydrogenase